MVEQSIDAAGGTARLEGVDDGRDVVIGDATDEIPRADGCFRQKLRQSGKTQAGDRGGQRRVIVRHGHGPPRQYLGAGTEDPGRRARRGDQHAVVIGEIRRSSQRRRPCQIRRRCEDERTEVAYLATRPHRIDPISRDNERVRTRIGDIRAEGDARVGMLRVEGGDRGHQQPAQSPIRCYDQLPRVSVNADAQSLFDGRDVVQDPPCLAVERSTGFRQIEAPGGALYESDPETALQIGQAPARCALGDLEFRRSGVDPARLDYRDVGTQVFELVSHNVPIAVGNRRSACPYHIRERRKSCEDLTRSDVASESSPAAGGRRVDGSFGDGVRV